MTTEESLADLWSYLEAGRGRDTASRLVQSWLHDRIDRHIQISPDLLYAIIDLRLEWPGDEHCTPKPLTRFIGRLASVHPAQSVLDPTCGLGLMLREVAISSRAQVIHGIDINAECCEVSQAMLGDKATILRGDALTLSEGLQTTYDLIVANPPFGLMVRGTPMLPYLGDRFGGDMGHALTAWACARLGDNGTAMVIVTPAFLWNKHALQAQEAIRKSGCRIRALIHLPGGTFPYTQISTYLAVFEGGEQQEVFIGEYTEEPEHQKSLIKNYRHRTTQGQPALGRLCPLADFRGFDAFAAQERLKRLVRTTGWPQHAAGSVILEAERVDSSAGSSEQAPSGLFLRLSGQPTAILDPRELGPAAMRDCLRLRINPEIADARYLMYWFNQSLVGQTTVASVRQGGLAPRIDLNALMTASLYLPPLPEQRHAIQGVEHLNRVRAEAMELEKALWSGVEKTDDVVQRIRTINQEDRYEDWVETLPFPMASILWRHRAGGGTTRERYEALLHFFEATAAFAAIIHLSAFMSDDSLWSGTSRGLCDSLSQQHLSLERATFGTWKLALEYLSGKCKSLRDATGLETCQRIYGTTNPNHIAMICHADLLAALQRANRIRNDWSGHTGAIGPDTAQSIHDELLDLVHKVRGVFGRSWLDYELIQPTESRYQGGIYHYRARRLMGTRSAPFEVVERESTQPLESDRLYLFDAVGQRGILLLPFIRVMPSPEKKANACFIFSRREAEGARFVSYHFEEESSIEGSFADVDEALQRIHLFDGGAKP
ncbi:MAG TPA: N-6 DNA methylase [Chloroflexota bacterium]|nr:N-6 DNA methylase [Chloroflexota bacterium]